MKQSKLEQGNGEVKHKMEDERKTRAQLISEGGVKHVERKQTYQVIDKNTHKLVAANKRLKHTLAERVKELRCLYDIAAIAEKPGITLDELYQEVANLLPSSWQYPEICCARITIEDKEFRTANYRHTGWKLCSDIEVGGVKAGAVEVNYLEKRPELDEGPFLREERRLIDTVAERVGKITEHKRAEEELIRLSSAVRMSTDSIVISNLDGKIIDVNEATLKMYGTDDKRDLIRKNSFDLIAPEELEKALAGTKEVLEKGYVKSREYHIITKDGGTVPVEMSVAIMKDADGKPIGFVGISRDITERKQAEEELEARKRRLESYIESMVDGVVLSDLKGTTVDINKACLELLGYKRKEDVVGRPGFIRAISKKDMPEIDALLEGIIKKGYIKDREITVLAQDRREIPILLSATLIEDPQGKPTSIFTIFKDITERKKTEAQIRKLSSVVEQSIDGIATADLEPKLTYVNDAFARMHGYSPAEMVGMRVANLHSEEQMDEFEKAIDQIKTKGSWAGELEHVRKDGTPFPTHMSVTLLTDEQGKPTGITVVCRDITEQKKAEKRLQESEGKLRVMFGSITDGVIVTDLTGTIVEANDGAAHLVGYSNKEELIGRNAFEFVLPKDRALAMNAAKKTLEERLVQERTEYTILTADGREIDTDSSTAVLYDSSGNPTGIINVVRDITERKKAEAQIRELSSVAAQAVDGIAIGNLEPKLIYVNDAFARMHGYSPAEMVGMRVANLHSEKQMDEFRKAIDHIKTKGSWTGELGHVRKDGTPFPTHMSVTLLTDEQGKPTRIATVCRDITERKKAGAQIRELSSVAEQAVDGIATGDLEPKLIYVNDAFARMHGYSPAEMVGMRVANLHSEEQIDEFKKGIDHIKTKGSWTGELGHVRKDGTPFPTHMSVTLLTDEQGKPTRIAAVCRDITEQKKAEEELQEKNEQLKAQREELVRKATELELVSQTKSEFLASMSHELRTPLSAVIGFSELMLDGIPGEINDEQRGCLNDILDSGRRLLSLINDILDLSKVEAGKIELKLQNLDIAAIISGVVQIIKPVLDKNGQEIEVGAMQGLPKVRGDKNRLEQILLNLLSNASKFTEQGGRVRIHVGRKGDYCQVAVIDTGIGIKKEDQKHVFEAFVQGETLSDRKKEGTGLGLTLTKRFVEAIGGRIWMESEYGKGSTFIFTIPLAGEPLETSLGDKQSSYS